MSHPIPLVTITLTTDEIAMASAALRLLRQHWAFQYMTNGEVTHRNIAGDTVKRITDFINRLDGSISEDQGRALLNELLKDLKRRPE